VREEEFTPSTFNDPKLTATAVDYIQQAIGKENVHAIPAVMGGEDFGRFGNVTPKIPSFIFWLGAVDPTVYADAKKEGKSLPSLHSPFFAPLPKPTIATGITSMSNIAIHLLQE
ncbi:MAG: peptidase M20, partial [Gammaproteobacteria bacterium CG22_combo_CG10-13_8_21_14_all_40_8]